MEHEPPTLYGKGHIGYCGLGQGPRVGGPRCSRNVGPNESQMCPQDLP